jgi:hypothetical protein
MEYIRVYQTILHDFNASLVKDKLRTCILYCIDIGNYGLNKSKFARMEAQTMLEYISPQGRFKRHDPKGLVTQHAKQVNTSWPIHMSYGMNK